MLDEPSLGLAPKIIDVILSVLAGLSRDGMGLLIVEQNVHAVLALAQRAYILEGGRSSAQAKAENCSKMIMFVRRIWVPWRAE